MVTCIGSKRLRLLLPVIFAILLQPTLDTRAAAQQSQGYSQLKLYDNFNYPFIDPTRWYTQWECSTITTMECRREIVNEHLDLRVRSYGDRDTNIGSEYGNAEIYLSKSAVTDFAAQVTVLRSASAGCTTSPGVGTHSQSSIWGTFFNSGSGTASEDVGAFLILERFSTDPPNVLHVSSFISYQGTFFGNMYLGDINLGEPVIAELKWDKANSQFVARVFRPVNGQAMQAAMPYTMSDSTLAVAPQKGLLSRSFPENCVGTQTYADTETWFDQVMTN